MPLKIKALSLLARLFMENILYLSYDGMTDSLGQSQVLPYLKGLSKIYKIHLVSFEKPQNLKSSYSSDIQSFCKQHQIEWYPLNYTKHPKVLSTIYDVFKLNRLVFKLERAHHFRLVHCRSYITSLIGLRLKKSPNTKFLFDMRGLWADERVDGDIWNLKNPIYHLIYRYFKGKEKQFLQHADAIVSLTEKGKDELCSWNLLSLNPEKIFVIPCCANLELFHPTNTDFLKTGSLKQTLQISEDNFILGYVGSIGTWYMLPEMLDFFVILLKHKPNSKFIFITTENNSTILKIANGKGIPREKLIITSCMHHEVAKYISLFNWSIFFIKPTYSKIASSPTKQGELMGMGIPVICNYGIGDSDNIIEKYHSGLIVNDFTSKDYEEIIQNIDSFKINKEQVIHSANEIFGLEKGIAKYLHIYQKLLS